MKDITDIVQLAQSGDHNGFAEIVRRYRSMAIGYAYSLLGELHLAEDAAQKAFIDAYAKLKQLENPTAFSAWFRRIISTHCRRLIQEDNRINYESIDSFPHLTSSERNPPETIERTTELKFLLSAIRELSTEEREAVMLFFMGGNSQKEMAEFLEIPISTIKNRIRTAKKQLKESILKMFEDNLKKDGGQEDKVFERQVLRNTLPLLVGWIGLDGDNDPSGGGEHKLGVTTLNRVSVNVPECRVWYVELRSKPQKDVWEMLVDEIAQHKFPGLSGGGEFNDQHLVDISRLTHLEYLDLSRCPDISDEGLAHLKSLTALKYLVLSGCQNISDKGLAIIRAMPHLVSLRLEGCSQLTSNTLRHTVGLDRLSLLTLGGTAMDDQGLELLIDKEYLTHLHLPEKITDRGLSLICELPGLKNPLASPMGFKINEYKDPTDSHIILDSKNISGEGLKAMSGLNGLKAIQFFKVNPSINQGIGALAGLPKLHELGMRDMDDQSLNTVATFPALQSLECGQAVAGDDGFSALGQCLGLEKIFAWSVNNLTSVGVKALSTLPNLRFLALGGKKLNDESLASLPGFAALQHFWTANENTFTDEVFASISQIPNLELLVNMYCKNTTDRASEHLVNAKKLKVYHIWGTKITDHSLELLSQIKTLEELLFWNCSNLSDSGLSTLNKFPSLKSVDIQECEKLTSAGIKTIKPDVNVNYQET